MDWLSKGARRVMRQIFDEGRNVCVKAFGDGRRYAGLYDGCMGGEWHGDCPPERADWLLAQGYIADTQTKWESEGCPVLTYRATQAGSDWAMPILYPEDAAPGVVTVRAERVPPPGS
jgi:hypothetical protein